MSNKQKTIQANFDYILKDFESDANPGAELEELAGGLTLRREARITFPPNQIDIHPYIVFIIFVYLKKFEFAGRWEKVAWEIQIKFKGTPFMLTHRKFGFRIIAYSESELISQRGVEAIEQIKKAIPLAEELIEPLIKSTVNARNITLANEYINIENRYHFFRKNAEHEFLNMTKWRRQISQN